MYQKILIMTTSNNSLRSEVQGWSWEDPSEVRKAYLDRIGGPHEYPHQNEVPVGLIRSGHHINYPTVLHAMGDGWKLMSPPSKYELILDDGNKKMDQFEWWLSK